MFETSRAMPSALIVQDHDDDAVDELAIEWVLRRHQEFGGEIVVQAPTLTLNGHPTLRRFMNLPEVRTTTFREDAYLNGGVILACWPSREQLARVTTDNGANALCVIDTARNDATAWARAVSPTILGSERRYESADLAIVATALEGLTDDVNQNNALTSYDDRDAAIRTLQILREHGHHLDCDDIYAWALRAGWRGDTAERLRTLVIEISAGKRKRVRSEPFVANVYEIWARTSRDASQ